MMDFRSPRFRALGGSRIADGVQTPCKSFSDEARQCRIDRLPPRADPFRRKTISFKSEMDRLVGAELVGIRNVGTDARRFASSTIPANRSRRKRQREEGRTSTC